MQVTQQMFKKQMLDKKNIKIILVLLIVLLGLLFFTTMRDTDTLVTHSQANALYSGNKIEKVVIDGDFIRLKTAKNSYKIYKGAINKTAFYEKYPVEVIEDNDYIYDLFSLLIIILAFVFFYQLLKQNRREQFKQITATNKTEADIDTEPVQAITSNITFKDVAGIKDVKEELEEIIDFLKEPKKYRDLDIRLPKGVLACGPSRGRKNPHLQGSCRRSQCTFLLPKWGQFCTYLCRYGSKTCL